jgi:hypothetical protein
MAKKIYHTTSSEEHPKYHTRTDCKEYRDILQTNRVEREKCAVCKELEDKDS